MGLIKDVLGSALGSDQIKNGFSNKRFSSSFNQNSAPSSGQRPYSSYSGRNNNDYYDSDRSDPNSGQLQPPPAYSRQPSRQSYNNSYDSDYSDYQQSRQQSRQGYNDYNDYDVYQQDMGYSQGGGRGGFRPLALPQISYGDGQPFLRGYSRELQRYNIPFRDFMQILDAINVAIIPNPEHQIFQKGANIAGWFLWVAFESSVLKVSIETNLEFSAGLVLLRLVSQLVRSVLELAHPWAILQHLLRSCQKQI